MNYQRIYDALITYRKANVITSGYFEKHHIVMRSLGGSDDESNLVRLTAREHYVAHLLLARFNRCSQTAFALWMMQCRNSSDDFRPSIKSSRMYEWARKEFIKYISKNAKVTTKGERNSQHGTRWICNIDLQENRKISKTDELPQGWILGRNKWVKKTNANAHRILLPKTLSITDGIINLRLYYEDQLPIPDGWYFGQTNSEEGRRNQSSARRETNFKLKGLPQQGGRKARVA